MAERFTEHLRQEAAGLWEAQHQHPFVRGIGDGTLGLERFKFWLRQDYVFLIEYARLLALAAARSPDGAS
jgi:thiaminase/transcriptional activator TenA